MLRKGLIVAFWLALAIVGQGALLVLLKSGTWDLGFLPGGALAQKPLALGILGVQLAAVAWGLRPHLPLLAARVHPLLLTALVLAWTASTTLLSRSAWTYALHFGLTLCVHVVNLGNLFLLARTLPPAPEQLPPRTERALPLAAAAFVLLASAGFSWLIFERIPHVPDSVAYLFQARTYAAGLPYLPSTGEPACFRQFLIHDDGQRWFSVFPPGWPLILAVGVLLGVPWLVNPALGAAGVLLAHALVQRLHGRGAANAVALLLALSPAYLITSASFLSHTSSIVWALLLLLGIQRSRSSSWVGWSAVAGLALGALFLTRPIEGVVLGCVGGAWALGLGGARLRATQLLTGCACALALGSLFLANNYLLTGRPFYDPIQMYFDQTFYPGCNAYGFGRDRGNLGWAADVWEGHGLLEAGVHINKNLSMLDIDLLGWGCGSLLFAGLGLAWGRGTKAVRLWVGLALLTVFSASLYWYSGVDLGTRYWMQCLVPLLVLTVLGGRAACERLGIDPRRMVVFGGLASLLGAVSVVPWRGLTRYHHYRGMRGDVARLASTHDLAGGLVLVRTREGGTFADYGAALVAMPLPLGRGAIYARADDPAALDRLKERYPGRPVWFLDAPSLTGGGWVVGRAFQPDSAVGQAFQPDGPKSQAGTPDLQPEAEKSQARKPDLHQR